MITPYAKKKLEKALKALHKAKYDLFLLAEENPSYHVPVNTIIDWCDCIEEFVKEEDILDDSDTIEAEYEVLKEKANKELAESFRDINKYRKAIVDELMINEEISGTIDDLPSINDYYDVKMYPASTAHLSKELNKRARDGWETHSVLVNPDRDYVVIYKRGDWWMKSHNISAPGRGD